MKFLLFVAVLSISSSLIAQDREVLNPNQLAVKEFNLEANTLAPSEIKLPFKRIRILDSRFDTSKIRYITNADILAGKKKAFKKMTFVGGTTNAIETYYNDYYAASFAPNDFELLIVIKRFWISGKSISNNKRVELANSGKDNNSIHCKWEYYIGKNGNYLPVKRMDTTFVVEEDVKNYLNDELSLKRLFYVKSSLNALIDVLDFSNAIIQFDRQTKKTLAQIKEFNERMKNIPVLRDSSFKKGVYLSFDDFKNNRPSVIAFQVKKMHYGKLNTNSEIYLEDMKGETISDYWGFSDGDGFRYGMLGNDKIYRVQNTFCFFIKVVGYVVQQGDQGQYGPGGINTISKDKYEIWVPFQIDMETGEVY
jgi:hypothetical protein